MQTNNIKFLSYFITAIILTLGLSISLQSLMAAWTAPTASPPVCATGDPGCDAPLNISNTAQQKAGMLVLNTGGSANGLIVDSGNVGIGTAAPVTNLHIQGDADTRLTIEDNAGNWLKIGQWMDAGASLDHHFLQASSGKGIEFVVNANNIDTPSVVISSNGNVGIGTVSPGAKLDIGGGGAGGVLRIRGGNYNQVNIAATGNSGWGLLLTQSDATSNGGYHYSTSGDNLSAAIVNVNNDALHFGTNNLARMTIDHTGNVGIGTTNPASKLEVAGIIHSTTGGIKFPDGSVQTIAAGGGLTL